jgi:hypothetical protein
MLVFLQLQHNSVTVAGRNPTAQLFYIKKKLHFKVYLAVKKKNVPNWRTEENMKLLKSVWWSTEIEAQRALPTSASAAQNFGFRTNSHIRNHGQVADVARKPDQLLPANTSAANNSIIVRLV